MKWISVGIAILYVIFFAYAVYSLYPEPENPCRDYVPKLNETDLKTNDFETCYENYRILQENHNFKSFLILGIVSILSIVGSLRLRNKTISSGILGGGTLLMIYASLRYWSSIGEIARLVLLGMGLGALLYRASH